MISLLQTSSENHVTCGRIFLLLLKKLSSKANYRYFGNDINNSKLYSRINEDHIESGRCWTYLFWVERKWEWNITWDYKFSSKLMTEIKSEWQKRLKFNAVCTVTYFKASVMNDECMFWFYFSDSGFSALEILNSK
jgi:hypothetical protein